jgi:hypothetical protein
MFNAPGSLLALSSLKKYVANLIVGQEGREVKQDTTFHALWIDEMSRVNTLCVVVFG